MITLRGIVRTPRGFYPYIILINNNYLFEFMTSKSPYLKENDLIFKSLQ